jgi:hypothetical protein
MSPRRPGVAAEVIPNRRRRRASRPPDICGEARTEEAAKMVDPDVVGENNGNLAAGILVCRPRHTEASLAPAVAQRGGA